MPRSAVGAVVLASVILAAPSPATAIDPPPAGHAVGAPGSYQAIILKATERLQAGDASPGLPWPRARRSGSPAQLMTAALKLDPDNARTWGELGYVQAELGRLEGAVRSLETGRKINHASNTLLQEG